MADESSVPYGAGTEGPTGPRPRTCPPRDPRPHFPRTPADGHPAGTGGFRRHCTITFRRTPVEEPT
ncbi:hypothetical protein AB0G60_28285 [Streptomyces angustmyceticus]|uniref:Uncharacterized protein n=1 Tax=Streptomyces angustmyceticus TaxID=285578 RepID=A0A5J4LQS0_9ACTN|nr:hypothetical protein [Streptomyces angustmyceticus]UAL69501.1 hypothetical protein K7396_25655 [Streptomyces angustmyceticus]GES32735.1 hypothetical protein San01_52230 [Streptomyces angustmyceticus]